MQSLTNGTQTGQSLESLAEQYKTYTTEMLRNKQMLSYKQCLPFWQAVLNLMGQSEDPLMLNGEAMDEDVLLFDLLESQNLNACLRVHSAKLWLAVIFGDVEAAKKIVKNNFLVAKGNNAGFGVAFVSFYSSIVCFTLSRRPDDSAEWRSLALHGLDTAAAHAANCPWNFQHKVELLQAENHFLNEEHSEAAKCYERSIESAERHGFVHEAALFSERAAMFYFAMGNGSRATAYFRKARDEYLMWGATRKAADLNALC